MSLQNQIWILETSFFQYLIKFFKISKHSRPLYKWRLFILWAPIALSRYLSYCQPRGTFQFFPSIRIFWPKLLPKMLNVTKGTLSDCLGIYFSLALAKLGISMPILGWIEFMEKIHLRKWHSYFCNGTFYCVQMETILQWQQNWNFSAFSLEFLINNKLKYASVFKGFEGN